MTAVVLAVFLLTGLNFSCKSYPPSFDITQLYSEYNDDIEFVDAGSYVALLPKTSDTSLTAEAGAAEKGIIFYPGGKVEFHSYLPLMTLCAQKGAACFIVKMPLNYAFMDKKAADKFPALYPDIKTWYLAGHSLGGAMAASYIADKSDNYEGLILLAAFSTRDLSETNLKVLSIYGSKDGVLNMEKYQEYKSNLPAESADGDGNGLTEKVIEGGNHAQFASYGAQKGDQIPDISGEEQQRITAQTIISWAGL